MKTVQKKWVYKKFVSADGVYEIINGQKLLRKVLENESLPKDATIVEEAWDHEHCGLCNEKIMEGSGNLHDGLTDGNNWLCQECYQQYIIPRLK